MRVIGYVYLRNTTPNQTPLNDTKSNPYIILCLGNSVTKGVGAPVGESYPDHLQNMFDKRVKEKKIQVINRGKDALNSAELLRMLESAVRDTCPDLIILQAGEPNYWNYRGYSDYLKRKEGKNRNNTALKGIIPILNDYIYRLRIYKLIRLMHKNIKDELDSSKKVNRDDPVDHGYRNQRGYMEALDWYGAAQQEWYGETEHGKGLFLDERKREEAIKWFKRGVAEDPSNPKNHEYIGNIYFYQRNYEEALKWYIEGIKAAPEDTMNADPNKNYQGLRKVYMYASDVKIRKSIAEFIQNSTIVNMNSRRDVVQKCSDWAESDIREIIRIIRKKGINLILQNYPPSVKGGERPINSNNSHPS